MRTGKHGPEESPNFGHFSRSEKECHDTITRLPSEYLEMLEKLRSWSLTSTITFVVWLSTLSWRRSLSYRNQSIDLLWTSPELQNALGIHSHQIVLWVHFSWKFDVKKFSFNSALRINLKLIGDKFVFLCSWCNVLFIHNWVSHKWAMLTTSRDYEKIKTCRNISYHPPFLSSKMRKIFCMQSRWNIT